MASSIYQVIENGTDLNPQISPLISGYTTLIFGYVNALVLSVLTGVVGMFTNAVNISVYLKMGLTETTNISLFSLSIADLFGCMSTAVTCLTVNRPIFDMKLPSGAKAREIGIGATFILYPCLGCSAWITAILSVERCLCIGMPLKVKEIVTPKRITILILAMVVYQTVFVCLFFTNPGPPYENPTSRRTIYFNSSFSVPSNICFVIVLISTIVLAVKLKQNMEWRSEAAQQSHEGPSAVKERRAARSVVIICTIFICSFTLNVVLFLTPLFYPKFNYQDPYLGNLIRVMFNFSGLFQVMSSCMNILVYYRMSSRYRQVFNTIFCKKVKKQNLK